MKKTFTLLCMLTVLTNLYPQSKNDYTWVLGYPTLIPDQPNTTDFGGMYMKFDATGYRIEQFDIYGGPVSAVANDEAGALLFYTNGCTVYNHQHQMMENGEDINIGASNYDMECNEYLGLFYIRSGNMTLPLPNDNSRQFLLHLRLVETSDTNAYDYLNDRLQFTEVDVQANNGLGKVLQKNQVLVADSLHDAISAVRHGNGRDWWVVIPRGRNSQFWKILLTPEGFQTPVLQTIPPPYPVFDIKFEISSDVPPLYVDIITPDEYGHECWAGQAIFSPDGSKYCRVLRSSGVEIYDFDRCTGEMTFRRYIPLPPYTNYPEEPIAACGLAISPNSRYLYFNNNEALFQFDLCEENIETGDYELIEEWDRFLDDDFFAASFFQMRNAPDGKIYINPPNSTHYMHIIHEPDKAGKACRFEQRGVSLPRWSYFVLNYFPNYRLYDLADSPCDTLGIDDPHPPVKYDFSEFIIFPNPAGQQVNLYVPQCEGIKIKVWNISGQLMKEEPFIPGMTMYPLNVSDWPAGAYILAAYIDDENPVVKKIVVTH